MKRRAGLHASWSSCGILIPASVLRKRVVQKYFQDTRWLAQTSQALNRITCICPSIRQTRGSQDLSYPHEEVDASFNNHLCPCGVDRQPPEEVLSPIVKTERPVPTLRSRNTSSFVRRSDGQLRLGQALRRFKLSPRIRSRNLLALELTTSLCFDRLVPTLSTVHLSCPPPLEARTTLFDRIRHGPEPRMRQSRWLSRDHSQSI